jgi:hypothetical protein
MIERGSNARNGAGPSRREVQESGDVVIGGMTTVSPWWRAQMSSSRTLLGAPSGTDRGAAHEPEESSGPCQFPDEGDAFRLPENHGLFRPAGTIEMGLEG